MTPDLLAQIKANCEQTEGRIPHFYLDTKGNVTIGIGHYCPNVEAALLIPLSPMGAVASDYAAVQDAPPGLLAQSYSPMCDSRMTDADIDALLEDDLTACSAQLATKLPFDTAPDPAQCAVLDMAFNLGTAKLMSGFPSFVAAFKGGDWATCAKECHRKGISEERNLWTAKLFNTAG